MGRRSPAKKKQVRSPSRKAAKTSDEAFAGVRSPQALAQRGALHQSQGNLSAAIEDYSAAIELNPDFAWAFAHRGSAKGLMGDLPGALRDFQKALDLKNGDYPWVYGQRGEAYRIAARNLSLVDAVSEIEGMIANGLEDFDRALAELPGNAWVHAHRGALKVLRYWITSVAFGSASDEDAGEVDLTQAVEINPGYWWALEFHAIVRLLKRDYDGAYELLGKAMAFDNRRTSLAPGLCMLLSYMGRDHEAISTGWEAIKMDPHGFSAPYFVATGLARLKDPSAPAAIARARVALKTAANMIALMELGLQRAENRLSSQEALAALREFDTPDLETLAIIRHDSIWTEIRDDLAGIFMGSSNKHLRRRTHG